MKISIYYLRALTPRGVECTLYRPMSALEAGMVMMLQCHHLGLAMLRWCRVEIPLVETSLADEVLSQYSRNCTACVKQEMIPWLNSTNKKSQKNFWNSNQIFSFQTILPNFSFCHPIKNSCILEICPASCTKKLGPNIFESPQKRFEGSKFSELSQRIGSEIVLVGLSPGLVCLVTSSNFKFKLDQKVQSWSLSHNIRLILKM